MGVISFLPPVDGTYRVRPPVLTAEVRENTLVVVALRGEADASTRPVLCDALARVIARSVGDVLIDLTEVSFIDIGTGRILAIARRLLEENDRRLGLRAPSTVAQRVLQMFEMTDLIEAQTDPRRDERVNGWTP
jgi:anti-anti-sigma factor